MRRAWLLPLPLIAVRDSYAESSGLWLNGRTFETAATLAARIAPPEWFQRLTAPPGRWVAWLRALPLKPADSPVLIYTGAPKNRQHVRWP